MFCPKCRAEYREGFTECSDCKVPLVSELPPEPEPEIEDEETVESVTVLTTGNPMIVALAKSLLDDAKIPYFVKGEMLQEMFYPGRIIGFNPIIGPVQIRVLKDDEEVARKVLEDLEHNNSSSSEDVG